MRIATFNLENLGATRTGDPDTAAQIDALQPQLMRLEADILCIQEANAPKNPATGRRDLAPLDALLDGTPYAAFHRAHTLRPGHDEPMDRHNLAILSRRPIIASRQVFHELVPPPMHHPVDGADGAAEPLRWDRPLLHAQIGLDDGRTLHVLNLHLRAPLAAAVPHGKSGPFTWVSTAAWAEGFHIAGVKRSGQALEARLVVERILDTDPRALILVAGDFNAAAGETPSRLLMADVEETGNGALQGRTLVALERSLPEDRRYTVIHAGRRVMLDHMLASRALLAAYRGMEVHNEALGDELVAYAVVEADAASHHAPVVAAFDLA